MFKNYGLNPGDAIRITGKRVRRCLTVVKEYPFFILANAGAYHTCVNKADLYIGELKMRRL